MSGFNFNPGSDLVEFACSRLSDAYSRHTGHEIPVVESRVSGGSYTYRELLEDLDKMLEHSIALANNVAAVGSDWPPFVDSYCTVVMVAEAFGCEVVLPEQEMPWARHAVTNISEVWSLRLPRMSESPQIRRTIEWIDYAQRKLGTEVPIWALDIQSPFSVAAQIVEPTELLAACLTDPAAVHHVCRMVTDFTIEMMQAHLEQIDHAGYPGRNFPSISENVGLCLADDTPLIMLSPEMYREFALPYNSDLGEVFGGLHIHSCGNYAHNLDCLMEVANIRSIQLHAGTGEFPLPESPEDECPLNRARGNLTYFVDVNEVSRGDPYRGRMRDHYVEYVGPRMLTGDTTGCIFESCGSPTRVGVEALRKSVQWTRELISKHKQ